MDKNEIVKMCLPMVTRLAHKTRRPASWEVEDVIQVGLLSILENLPKYDPMKGEFRNWAWRWARRAMVEQTVRNQGAVCQNHETTRQNSKKRRREDGGIFNARPYEAGGFDDRIVGASGKQSEARAELAVVWPKLSPQLQQVFSGLAQEYTGPEIGEALDIGHSAVSWHVRNYQKTLAAQEEVIEGAT